MRREEISVGIGNIKAIYIQEAVDFSVSVDKTYVIERNLVFEYLKGVRNKKRLGLKLSVITICVMLMFCGGIEFIKRNWDITESHETAYKPSIMYDDELYLLSPHKADSFEIDESELKCVGSIEDSISGGKLATKNFQSSGNDLVGCDVYIAEKYPKTLFVFDHIGDLYVYEIND